MHGSVARQACRGLLPLARSTLRHQPRIAPASLLSNQIRVSSRVRHKRGSSSRRARVGAGAVVAEVAEPLFELTGVPLVDELMKFSSVDAAAQHSLKLLIFLGAVALVGTLLLRATHQLAGRHADTAAGGRFSVAAAVLASAARPCEVMLPIYCALRAATVALGMAQVAVTKSKADFARLLCCTPDHPVLASMQWCRLAAGGTEVELLPVVRLLTQLAQDTSELALIIFLAWAAIDFKGRLLTWMAAGMQADLDPQKHGMVPLLALLNRALDFFILTIAGATTLVGFGFHIGPLMASLGGVGVVLGLATQGLLMNVASAVSLYVTRPFVAGDQVQLVNPEGVEIEGTVLTVEPTRTILRNDSNGCIVHISNADVSAFIIKNYTQCRTLGRLQELQDGMSMREMSAAIRSTDTVAWVDMAVAEGPVQGSQG